MLQFDGSKLKKLRQGRNLKQKELALLVGKQAGHIANYENGIADPPAEILLRLMSFFEVTAKDLSKKSEAVTV